MLVLQHQQPRQLPKNIFPNPVSDILNIKIEEESKDNQQAISNAKNKKETVYDIRLYDGQSNLLRQSSTKGGTIQFNVSNLPDGIYYLHVYDGVNSTPEIQQIIVEH
jgi:hypothetical protein